MLRSRSNRSQRPSESTDEVSSSTYSYGGYPAAAAGLSSPMEGVSSGAASDNAYGGATTPRAGKFRSSMFGSANRRKSGGFGSGGHLGGTRDKHSGTIPGGKGRSTRSAVVYGAMIVLIVLSGATWYYRKMTMRLQAELAAVKRRNKSMRFHPHFDGNDPINIPDDRGEYKDNIGNDNEPPVNPQDLIDLRSKNSQLQGESSKLTMRNKSVQDSIEGLKAQMVFTEKENSQLAIQLEKLHTELHENNIKAEEWKKALLKSREENRQRIVPGKGVQTMETLEDMEAWVQQREDALWSKIDLLLERIQKESRREALEW